MADIIKNLENVRAGMFEDATDALKAVMVEAESQARLRAPWKDITSQARASITQNVDVDENRARGILAIGAEYGVWLELANGGKYKILRPTLFLVRKVLRESLGKIKFKKGVI